RERADLPTRDARARAGRRAATRRVRGAGRRRRGRAARGGGRAVIRRPVRTRRSTLDGRLAELERLTAPDDAGPTALVAIYDVDAHRRDPAAEEARAR